jgi:type I restriction enzyme M protein
MTEIKNAFCKRSNLTNEASVETWFIDRLLTYFDYEPEDIQLKTSIREFKVGHGSKSSLYKPDYVISLNGYPTLVIDAKHPGENIDDWISQCSSYCLELNKLYEHNPVEYFLLSNGVSTRLYKWDKGKPLVEMQFEDFVEGSALLAELRNLICRSVLKKLSETKREDLMESSFRLEVISLDDMAMKFYRLHRYIWQTDVKFPGGAFQELLKIVFIKIKKDRELRAKIGPTAQPKVKDVIFSVAWIQNQTENENPVNDPLFKNLVRDLDVEIRDQHKRRIFDSDENINLSPGTILRIVRELEHIDFFQMDEDVHGRMFESFLDATVRGKALGQFFTPRDIVNLMVHLADVEVSKDRVETVLDACCGSGGFLISAMSSMLAKAKSLVGLSNKEYQYLRDTIVNHSLLGIDAGSDPPIYRIARMNMYLHGDGGTNIYFANSLDKNIGLVGKSNIELDAEIKHLRKMIITEGVTFDVILSNPPFSMKYARDDREQVKILNQYEIAGSKGRYIPSLLSSVMFLERYKELVSDNGRIFAIIDDSVLSGESYRQIRNYIRASFIIIGIISLPGDAFKRADARVKTSILILRKRQPDEKQPNVFMEKSVYLGLTPKISKRIGIPKGELVEQKPSERDRIVANYRDFLKGKPGPYVVEAEYLSDRLDVKHCLHESGRSRALWIAKGKEVERLDTQLTAATRRAVKVTDSTEYKMLKVTYDGDVLEADRKYGEDLSYTTLFQVKTWDILVSNMGVGRGAVGIVPEEYNLFFVSNEYTILAAKNKEDAIYYTALLRTKEILSDILSSTTGMNRGRIKWQDMRKILIPVRDSHDDAKLNAAVNALESLWEARRKLLGISADRLGQLVDSMNLESAEARLRWLAYKPPE